MLYVALFFCAATAWFVACLFNALPTRDSAANAAVSGAVCTSLAFLLSLVKFHADLTLILFLPLAISLPIQEKWNWEERLMALLTSLGTYALLALFCRTANALLSEIAATLLVCLITGAFAVGTYAQRRLFPPKDWREYFAGNGNNSSAIYRWHIYLPLGLMAGLEIALLYGMSELNTLLSAAVIFAVGTALCWGALYVVSLMVAYRREKLTTLIDQDYRSEMQSFMSVIRSQRHDYNFHVQALSGLIDEGNIDECRQYLHNLVRDSAAMNTILPVKDPAIGAMIFSFRTMAMEYGIELHMDIQNDLSCVVTSVYETNKVIGNLLQNAIDEVKTHKDKSFGIHLYILKRGENCIIHVANKIAPREDTQAYIQGMYSPGHSTKTGHEGIGLSSIQNMLRRYRGVVYSRIDDDIIHCFAKIPLRLGGGAE